MPSRPTDTAAASSVPSSLWFAAAMKILAPGLSSLRHALIGRPPRKNSRTLISRPQCVRAFRNFELPSQALSWYSKRSPGSSTRDAEFTEAFAIPPASWVHPFKLRGRTGRGRSTIRQSLISPSAAYSCITECGSSTELKALMSAKKAQTVGARDCDLHIVRPD